MTSQLLRAGENGRVFCRIEFSSGRWCEYRQDEADHNLYIVNGDGIDLQMNAQRRLVISEREIAPRVLQHGDEDVPLEEGRMLTGEELEERPRSHQ